MKFRDHPAALAGTRRKGGPMGTRKNRSWPKRGALLLIACCAGSAAWAGQESGFFEVPERMVLASPTEASRLELAPEEKVLDLDVSPTRAEALILIRAGGTRHLVRFWRVGEAEKSLEEWKVSPDLSPRSISAHPGGGGFFLSGRKGDRDAIVRVDACGGAWCSRVIFSTQERIRRLVVGTRPHIAGKSRFFRLYFGLKLKDGAYGVASVREDGSFPYVVASHDGWNPYEKEWKDPQNPAPVPLETPSALPVAFHPGGTKAVWEGKDHCFNVSSNDWGWADTHALREGSPNAARVCGGSVTFTPNGLALLHWTPGKSGIAVILPWIPGEVREAADDRFVSTPSSVPDGRGIIGVVETQGHPSIVYVPIHIPLSDVANAWMFVHGPAEAARYEKDGGVFHPYNADQLYNFYDSEVYSNCGYTPDISSTARPYLVTTDLFWDLFLVALDGVLVVRERSEAMPAFWRFVKSAAADLGRRFPGSTWARVFGTLQGFHAGKVTGNPEVELISKAEGRSNSPAIGREFDYGDLKPRGHYDSDDAMRTYFKAFRYLTEASGLINEDAPLNALPEGIQKEAAAWIRPYQALVAPPRRPVIWKGMEEPIPAYVRHPPEGGPSLFPLAWGFDNEVLNSVVYHELWPESEQIRGPKGDRFLPTGADLAAALGNPLAESFLQESGTFENYPPLRGALNELKGRFREERGRDGSANLYESFLSALAVQWTGNLHPPSGWTGEKLWQAKRLQTGLAAWTTIRHAMALVSDRGSAECDEGGLEHLLAMPPRGYVEPDPATLSSIAHLFGQLMATLETHPLRASGGLAERSGLDDSTPWLSHSDTAGLEAIPNGLQAAVLRRLKWARDKVLRSKTMSEKELRGEPLTREEYEEIYFLGAIEHDFLVLKSLSNPGFALAEPEPMAKVADVFGSGGTGFMMAAVGYPLEWDQIVPFYGRREITKGAVYSYYEYQSKSVENDKEWQDRVASTPRPEWINPFCAPTQTGRGVEAPF